MSHSSLTHIRLNGLVAPIAGPEWALQAQGRVAGMCSESATWSWRDSSGPAPGWQVAWSRCPIWVAHAACVTWCVSSGPQTAAASWETRANFISFCVYCKNPYNSEWKKQALSEIKICEEKIKCSLQTDELQHKPPHSSVGVILGSFI